MTDRTPYSDDNAGKDDGPPPFGAGHQLTGDYRIIAHIRRGNDLDVYDAWSDARSARCVVKTIRPDKLEKASARRRLLREGKLLQRLTHPHIVRAYETMTSPQPIVILETLGGETLSHLIERRDKRLRAVEVAYLGLHLCSAIHYLHQQRMIHLDVKPSNIIASAGIAKLLDLSIARPPGNCRGGVGSYGYMSPEQNHGGIIGPKSDVWGIGAVLFAAATAETPFDDDATATDAPQPDVPFAPLLTLRRLPRPFASVIDACLEIDPDRRPTIPELSALLTAVATPDPLV
ncbi:MAG: serine/threonine protein kinase [Chloroflexota bacterium]|nr:serine/threonine protein kinase [Chloroflexota bacterium]